MTEKYPLSKQNDYKIAAKSSTENGMHRDQQMAQKKQLVKEINLIQI
jgi:hypothetical protein